MSLLSGLLLDRGTSSMREHPLSESSLPSIVARAKAIADCAQQLIACADHSEGKFQLHSPPETSMSLAIHHDHRLSSLRSRLIEGCDELLHLVTGPREHLMATAQAHRVVAALQYATHFDLASHIPADLSGESEVSFESIATGAGVPVGQCKRILRLLMTCHIFRESPEGYVAHTPDSQLLKDESINAMIGYWTDESFLASSYLSMAAKRWPDSQCREHTAFNLAFDTNLPKFDFFTSEPWRARRFGQAMSGMTQGDRFSMAHLCGGYDWSNLPTDATIVDIGGSNGHCSIALATERSHLLFVVQDLESALKPSEIPEAMQGRIRTMAHDFFSPQPIVGKIFLLRWILHDYPDRQACEILRAQLGAMRPGSKLIIMEGIMMPLGTQSRVEERKARLLDIAMMSLLNSSERDLTEWLALFEQADPRLRLVSVCTPIGSALSIMELELT